jgi:hypothetical protein
LAYLARSQVFIFCPPPSGRPRLRLAFVGVRHHSGRGFLHSMQDWSLSSIKGKVHSQYFFATPLPPLFNFYRELPTSLRQKAFLGK